jgi:hypothetical protein
VLELIKRKLSRRHFRVVALLTVRNEESYLERCLQHLYEQGVHTCLIDNGSTDATVEIARSFVDRGVIRIETIPYRGCFELERILENEQRLSLEIEADWFIHHDADEIRQAPSPYKTLFDGIRDVDRQGYNAINFDEFVFMPYRYGPSYDGGDYVRSMKHYYFFEPTELHRVNAWKKNKSVNLVSNAGHRVILPSMRIFPHNFILRHYISKSREHLVEKYGERKFSEKEVVEYKWHGARVDLTSNRVVLPDIHQLKQVTEPNSWDKSDAWKIHGFMGPKSDPIPFVVGVGRSGTTLLRMMLDAHSNLSIPPETHFVHRLLALTGNQEDVRKQFLKTVLDSGRWGDFQIDADFFKKCIEQLPDFSVEKGLRLFYSHYAEMHNKKRWGDKTPPYQLEMAKIHGCLPESHFIHIIRDGRDVAVSARNLWFGAGDDIKKQAVFWRKRILATREEAKRIPYYMEVRYEKLVNNPEIELRKIASFIRLPFEEEMLNYHNNSEYRLSEIKDVHAEDGSMLAPRSKRLKIHKLVSRKPDTSRIGRWKSQLSPEDKRIYEQVAGDLLEELGYEVSE